MVQQNLVGMVVLPVTCLLIGLLSGYWLVSRSVSIGVRLATEARKDSRGLFRERSAPGSAELEMVAERERLDEPEDDDHET